MLFLGHAVGEIHIFKIVKLSKEFMCRLLSFVIYPFLAMLTYMVGIRKQQQNLKQFSLSRFAKEVESKCLGIFVRSLNSDINEYEVARRSKLSKTTLEKRLALGFWLLSEVVADRTSLSRECVLTSFSIHPTQERLDRIVELAKLSGLDQIEEEDCKEEILPDEKTDKARI